MQIKTTKLQEMVSKAVKGVGANKLVPLTEMIAIKLDSEVLTITSTDINNYLNVTANVEGDDFYAVIYADQFSKLIARTTSEDVELTVVDRELKIKGNGEHAVPVILDDETGNMLDYPDPSKEFNREHRIGSISADVLRTILSEIKPSVATTVEIPQYTNYYVGEFVMATDTYKIGWLDSKVFDEPKLISVPTMDLLEVLMADTPIEVFESNGKLLFISESGTLYAPSMPGIDTYQVERIMDYIQQSYPCKCKLPKLEVLQLLDRLSLFVDINDNGAVSIAFGKDGVTIASQQSNSVEVVPYLSCEDFADSQGVMYLDMFRAQAKAQTGDALELHFGDGKSLKLVDSVTKVTSIVCLASKATSTVSSAS